MDRLDVLPAAALQHAGAVDHGVHPSKSRPPCLGREVSVEIDGNRLGARRFAAKRLRIADGGNDRMAACGETSQQLSADEAVGTGQQDSHITALA